MVTATIDILDKVNEVNILTDRVKKRLTALREAKIHAYAARSHLITQSWKETEGQPMVMRRVLGFKKVMEEIPIVIREGELIVGSLGLSVKSCYPPVEYNADTFLKEWGEKGKLSLTEDYFECDWEDKENQIILEDLRFWQGKSSEERAWRAMDRIWDGKLRKMLEARLWTNPSNNPPTGCTVNYPKVLNEGLNGVIAEIKKELAQPIAISKEGLHKQDLLRAMLIGCEAVIHYARRHGELAKEMAEKEADPVRKSELYMIAEICDWVPANPARNLQEALQSFWFIHLCLFHETAGWAKSPGRFDQYMYPFYEKDIQENLVSRQEAGEMLACVWIKLNEMLSFRQRIGREALQASEVQNVTIGGVTKQGEDATNELSYMLLQVEGQLKVPQPQLTMRYHDSIPRNFFMKALETATQIAGKPAFFNDRMAILSLVQAGIPLEDARDWAPQGCVEKYVQFSSGSYRRNNVNFAKCLEYVFTNGVERQTGEQLFPQTGDPRKFSTFTEFYEALKKQFTNLVDATCDGWSVGQLVRAEDYPIAFHSALSNDCITKGLDVLEGGLRYNQLLTGVDVIGHQNVANGLAAVKKLIYEEKKITMDELIEALDADFKGKENIQAMLLAAPKYGNDDDYVDAIMVDIFRWTEEIVKKHINIWGYPVIITRKGLTLNMFFGQNTGALPDGHNAGKPLADGSLSPSQGTDHCGPTAVLNSAAKTDQIGSEATLINQKFFKSTMDSKSNREKLMSLIKTYFDRYGYHVQFNFFDPEVLKDAQVHPEQYRDLVVRVAGFSAYFVDLTPELQDEIIARTTQSL
ncbi:glycyl radical protein [Chloroflexota bacterium]